MAEIDVIIGYLATTPDMIRGVVVPNIMQKIVPINNSPAWLSPVFAQGNKIVVRSMDDNECTIVDGKFYPNDEFWESNLRYLTTIVFRYLEQNNVMENVYLFYRIMTEHWSFKLSCAAYEIPEFSEELLHQR